MAEGSDGSEGVDHSGDGQAIEVAPGATGDLTYTFDEPGTLLLGCHEPGHYEAGMVATIVVVE